MYFDTHAHYDDEDFNGDRDALLRSMPGLGVSLILNPGCDRATSEKAISYAEAYPYVWAAVGWHPHEARTMDDESAGFIMESAKHPKVVAVGEIGLDYHYDHSPRDIQKQRFAEQMGLARDLKLPVIIHDREAHADTMEIIRSCPGVSGVFHCYSGGVEMAREILALGWYISFTGAVTFNNARRALEVIAAVPDDRIMIETDAPYMAPVPYRGKRNDSSYLPYTAKVIAEIKGLSVDELARITLENGKRFFGIE